MATFFARLVDQMSHMFVEIQDAVSAVAVFVILSECPIERNWSVAQLSVAPAGCPPIVQYAGSAPSKLAIEGRSVA
jgi:hypothetical protein